ncbi:MAG: alpha/beta fold hydrolase, partial [Candidatus Zixiibacteriota bacterium]
GQKISRIDRMAREKGLETARRKWKDISLGWYGPEQEDIRKLMEKMIDEYSGSAWKDDRRGNYPKLNDMDKLDKIQVPTRIFAGRLDKIFLRLARLLHEGIAGSHLSIIDNVGHMLNLEASEQFNAELKVFLEGVAGTR